MEGMELQQPSPPIIWQSVIDTILEGILRVKVYNDDTAIFGGQDLNTHLQAEWHRKRAHMHATDGASGPGGVTHVWGATGNDIVET
mmetsp:Transcript_18607/g.52021  ORF Transcript_18607/g.52021 Transcript_18607/m.52021 type:complete len:86 (-) Transcript_18607:23-280(-)